MRSLRSALIFIGVAALAFGLLDGVLLFTSGYEQEPEIDTIIALLPAWSFVGTGLFAWWRRPHNRSGLLMVIIGFTWLLIPLGTSDVPTLVGIGILTANVAWVVLAQLLLSFPGGRLETSRQRLLIGLLYLDAVVLPAFTALFSGPELQNIDCSSCPPNPVTISNSPSIANVLDGIATVGAILLLVTLIVMLTRRYRSLESANREAYRPVLRVGAATVLLLGILVSSQALGATDVLTVVIYVLTVISISAVPFAFLYGLLQSRFSSAGAVSELIATLGERSVHDLEIRDALAGALGDSSLQFAYWLPDREIYVDSDGLEIELPAADSGRGWTPVEHDGELIAAIVYDDSIADDQQLIKATGSAAALALRNERLEAELRANVEELRASRARIVQASDTARRELERNLHDGAQQHLVSMALTLRMATEVVESDPNSAKELLTQASADLAEATTELRELARGIHPAILTDKGLGAALGALAGRSTVPVALGAVPEERLPAPIESAAYFVAAEALTNVARYSEAGSAAVDVTRADGYAAIEIRDDGIGGARLDAGSGLKGLEDRVAALDGKLVVVSDPGSGTTIRAEFPCAQ